MEKAIKIPEKSILLAEECGIHFGDGYMKIKKDNWGRHYEYAISEHSQDDRHYIEHIKNLMRKLYDLETSYERTNNNTFQMSYMSKKLVNFKLSIGAPLSPKNNLIIPIWIKENKEYYCAFLRGLFDTDGSLSFKGNKHNYPCISFCSKDFKLVEEVSILLRELRFTFNVCKHNKKASNGTWSIVWDIGISGRKNLENFMNLIGFNNYKHTSKYLIWQKYSFCPPNTNLKQRESILSGELNLLLLNKKIKCH